MPISPITLQRRHAEQGRIRLGHKVVGKRRDGSEYTRPEKLSRFRFTSPNQRLIQQIAEIYGGEAQPWDNDGKHEWEVLTEATSIPVTVVKGGFSQWMETWAGKQCIHRCDGERGVDGELCDLEEMVKVGRDTINPHAAAKPTTRLSVMLADERIEGIGVWRMESKGWNAAAELPTMAELAMHVGDLVPATLALVERSAVIQTDKGPQTSRFVVPVLDLHVSKKRLVELVGGVGGTAALGQTEQVAIEAAPTPYPSPGYGAQAMDATTVDEVKAIWRAAGEAGHLDDEVKAVLTARVEQIKADEGISDDPTDYDDDDPRARIAAAKREAQQSVNEDGTVDAEVVDDPTPTTDNPQADPRAAVWQQLLAAAGGHGLGFNETRDLVEQHAALPLADCTVEHLQAVLTTLTTGEVPEGASA